MEHGTRSGRMSLNKCVFGYEGKITLFSFQKNPALCEQWMQFVLPGQQWSFSSVFVDEHFINKAQFDAGLSLDTERWSGDSDDFKTADGK